MALGFPFVARKIERDGPLASFLTFRGQSFDGVTSASHVLDFWSTGSRARVVRATKLAHQVSAEITVPAYWQQPRHWPW
jgi:hypothetical protein